MVLIKTGPMKCCLSFCLMLLSSGISAYNQDPSPNLPNVLLITIDTLRTDRVSVYSDKYIKTPVIDSIASRGTVFTQAFANTPTTLPSHTNILTGTTPLYHGVHDNGIFTLDESFITIAEILKDQGYATAAFIGAYPLDKRFGLGQGFDVYDDEYGSVESQKISYVERKAEVVIERAVNWLQKRTGKWFLWIHLFDPHNPYDPPEPFKTDYTNRLYDGEVAYVDHSLGKLVDYMESAGLFKQTLIVLTGDHGESLGEHSEETHGYFAYNSTLHIPLIIAGPETGKKSVGDLVGHVDIVPTICAAVGVAAPSWAEGLSLLPLMRGEKFTNRTLYFESLYPYYSRGWAPIRGVLRKDEKFIESPIPEYYDLKRDFDETKNLLREIDPESYRAELKSLMDEKTAASPQKKMQPRIDGRALAKLKSLGYISGSGLSADREFGQKHDVKRLLPYHNKAMSALREFQAGNMMKAVDMLKEILTERVDIDVAYSNLASIYRGMGRLGDAIEVARLGMNNLPESYEVFSILVNYLIAAGLNDEAIALIEGKSIHAADSDPEIWNYLGVARSRKGEFEAALQAFAKSLSLDPDYPVAYMNRGLAHIGHSKKEKKDVYLDLAIKDFRTAIRLTHEMSSAYNGLGIALFESGFVDEAVRSWEKALALNPQSIQTHYNLGMALLDQGKKADALLHLETYKEKAGPFLSSPEREKLDEAIAKCRILSKK
ncbi:MAG: sulfatase-like hydrolase/transferase [Candidatus Aminicenantes bacterium]|nr:sulfatase-like hydrolase/transferase [Candidatus Aminicenantes bacterium]